MKSIVNIFLLIIIFSSCTNEYYCECTINSDGTKYLAGTTKAITKNKANKHCADWSTEDVECSAK